MMTTVLADCPTCKKEVEAKIVDCDGCYEAYLERGGHPEKWDDLYCEHIECLECGEDLSA